MNLENQTFTICYSKVTSIREFQQKDGNPGNMFMMRLGLKEDPTNQDEDMTWVSISSFDLEKLLKSGPIKILSSEISEWTGNNGQPMETIKVTDAEMSAMPF